MRWNALISAFAVIVFAAGICQADSLVITYRSGKTQTIVLDEPSNTINSWQFVGGVALQQEPVKPVEQVTKPDQVLTPAPAATAAEEKKLTEKAPEMKSGIRVKWNAPPIPD